MTSLLKKIIRRAVYVLLAIVLLLIAAILAIRFVLMPDLSVLQPRLEAVFAQGFQQAVHLKGFKAEWAWRSIDVTIERLTVGESAATQTPTLSIDGFKANIDTLPLLTQTVVLNAASASAATLTVVRKQEGSTPVQWLVAGIPLTGASNPSAAAHLRSVLGVSELAIGALSIDLIDETRHWIAQGKLHMQWQDLKLSNTLLNHALTARSAQGAASIGIGPVDLSASFNHALLTDTANIDNWREGTLKLGLSKFSPQAVQDHWQRIQNPGDNQWSSSQLPLAKYLGDFVDLQLQVKSNRGLSPDSANAVLSPAAGAALWVQAKANLNMASKPKQPDILLTWAGGVEPSTTTRQFSITTSGIDLAALYQATGKFLPIQQTSNTAVLGEAKHLRADWSLKPLNQQWQIQNLQLNADLHQAGLNSWRLIDGQTVSAGNLSGKLVLDVLTPKANHRTWKLSTQWDSQQAWLEAPGWLGARLQLGQIKGGLSVQSSLAPNAPAWLVTSDTLSIKHPDLTATLNGTVRSQPANDAKHAAHIDLKADVAQLRLEAAIAMVPKPSADAPPGDLISVLHQLPLNGWLKQGQFALKTSVSTASTAPAWRLQTKDVLSLNAKLEDVQLAPKPSWGNIPAVSQLQTHIKLQGMRLAFEELQANAQGMALRLSNATIPDFKQPVLGLQGSLKGDAQAALRWANTVPSIKMQWQSLGISPTAQGPVNLEGSANFPLNALQNTTFAVKLRSQTKQFKLTAQSTAVSDLVLDADFTENALNIKSAQANWNGGFLNASGQTQWSSAQDGNKVSLEGSLDLAKPLPFAALWSNTSLDTQSRWLQALQAAAMGTVSVKGQATRSTQGWRVNAQIDPSQTAINLPLLYQKPVGTTLPMTLQWEQRKQWTMNLKAGTGFELDIDTQGGFKAGVAVGQEAVLTLPESGIKAHINVPQLNGDALIAYLTALPWSSGTAAQTAATTGLDSGFQEPIVIALQADDLTLTGRHFKHVVAGIERESSANPAARSKGVKTWQASAHADGLNGYLTWQEARNRSSSGTLSAKLTTLLVPDAEVKSASKLLDIDPSQVPHVDLEVESLTVAGKSLGNLKLKARNLGVDKQAGSGWAIERLQLTAPDSDVQAQGAWSRLPSANNGIVQLDFTGKTQDFGATLTRLGYANVLRGSAGQISGKLNWRGTPFGVDIPSLSGQLNAQFEKGQFLKVEPGAARLLTLFSLQSIPRRLTLDFRDLFSAGFAFDSLKTSATIAVGIMETKEFTMESPAAQVRGAGKIDLVQETQALRFTVRPDFNAGGVSVAYMLVNPPLGLGTLLAQWLLREPIRTQLTVEYDVTGPWSVPVVTQVDRSVKLKPEAKAAAIPP